MKILEEFWYGNIEPTEYDTSSCKEYKKLLELTCRNEEKLKATMTDEQKELFEKYADCVREFQTITDCLIFQNSFKLGARMMLEVMEEQKQYVERTTVYCNCRITQSFFHIYPCRVDEKLTKRSIYDIMFCVIEHRTQKGGAICLQRLRMQIW